MSGETLYKVVVLDHTFTDLEIERAILEPIGAEIFEYQCSDPAEAAELAADADAVLVTNCSTLTRATIFRLQKCKIIVKHGIGVDIVDVAAAAERGIMVANLPDYCLREVSEHALALLFAAARKLPAADRVVRAAREHDIIGLRPIKPFYESTIGIVGFGRIGWITAGNLAALAGRIVFSDPFVGGDETINGRVCEKTDFAELCRVSDFIVIHAPYTGENYHMFDARAFAAMERAPYIVNVGRGQLIDNAALEAALESGLVSGAALDVVEGAPPFSPDDPMLRNDKIIFTPHCAWYSEASYKRIQADAANEVKRVLEGGEPRNWYNKGLMVGDGTPTLHL